MTVLQILHLMSAGMLHLRAAAAHQSAAVNADASRLASAVVLARRTDPCETLSFAGSERSCHPDLEKMKV